MTISKTDERIKEHKVIVKDREYTYFRVYLGTTNGGPKYKQFKTTDEAESYLATEDERQKVLKKKVGRDARKLKDDTLRDALIALETLNGKVTLSTAADYYVKSHGIHTAGPTVNQVFNELIRNRTQKGCKPPTIHDIKRKLKKFIHQYGNSPIQDISISNLEQWLDKVSHNAIQRKKYRTQLSGLFSYASRKNFIQTNIVQKLEVPIIRASQRPKVFSVAEAERLLRAAEAIKPEMIPYFALCLFAGIRPHHESGEIGRLCWENILFKSKQIWISQDIAKRPIHERYIDMSDNLIAWLQLRKHDNGPIYFSQHWCTAIKIKSGVKWSNDITRHTFGTYHFGLHKSFDQTCEQMGTSYQMYKKHYKAVLDNCADTDPVKFWNIYPKTTEPGPRF